MSAPFVLVTGAWHGGWAWHPVAEHLRAAGHTVHTPTLPGLADGDDRTRHSLSDVVRAIVELVEREDLQDVTLVGHSWGGYPITGAAPALASRLRKVVYWSAFVPAAGRSLHDEVPPQYQQLFASLAEASGDNSVALPFEVWQAAFMNDAAEEAQRIVHSLMVPQPYQYFTEIVDPIEPDQLGVPLAYVLSEHDVALPPGEYGWARFAERLGVPVQPAPGSHEACFTQPAGLAEAFLRA
ncbi:pimeloyl-ACP methyl ester carboxylesterase [Blastococcus colisei]|uniref:Pimeloyl-ACP methyl ester carboxylesterase n=1 Tax=Blastococcus colisei TaxID=1564162 RepID=A0A543PDV8_9ACTN|nr:alpha/beta fold hydrolase [Blastococcus colisei]TQN42274.1 pimeloyl-ACP methyl ester carboxylesterase [Blastococcus colisei]